MKHENLDRLLQHITDTMDCAGNGLAVYKNGKCLYAHAAGCKDLENKLPMETDTIFRAYSITKVFAVVCGLMLYQDGIFTMDQPVSDFIPELKDMLVCKTDPRGDVELVPAKNPVRFRDLFAQTSGMTGKGYAATSICGQMHLKNFEAMVEKTNGKYNLKDFVDTIAASPLAFEPGTHFHYGNSFEVLGRVVEIVSGKTIGEFMEERIFKPLGMNDTAFRMSEEKRAARLTCQYNFVNGQFEKDTSRDDCYEEDATFEACSGGLLTTLSDCNKFAQALACGEYQGVRLLKDEVIKLMQSNFLEGEALLDFNTRYRSHGSDFAGYGYGCGVRTLMDPVKAGALSNVGEFGWYGATGSILFVDPAIGLSAVYLHQTSPFNGKQLLRTLRDTMYTSLEEDD